jgi:hypothetical protein
MSKNPHEGTDFYDYLKEEGIYKEVHVLMRKKYGHLMEKNKVRLFGRIRNFLRSIAGIVIP